MKKSVYHSLLLLAPFVVALVAMSFVAAPKTSVQEKKSKPWIVPDAAKKVKNPTESSKDDLKTGKTLYGQHCKSCHGAAGLGDGPKAAELNTACGDFTTKEFQAQTDGAIFYKVKEGREDMPSFKKKISEDEDIWAVVDYVKTLGK